MVQADNKTSHCIFLIHSVVFAAIGNGKRGRSTQYDICHILLFERDRGISCAVARRWGEEKAERLYLPYPPVPMSSLYAML